MDATDFHTSHTSEIDGIACFEPRPTRPTRLRHRAPSGTRVWASEYLYPYPLPHACPRITFWRKTNDAESNGLRFLGDTSARYVLRIESGGLARAMNQRLFNNETPAATVELQEDTARHFVLRQTLTPIGVTIVNQPLAHRMRCDVELHEAIVDLTQGFYVTRLGNAFSPPAGFVTKHRDMK